MREKENKQTAKAINRLFLYLIGQDPATLATQALIRRQVAIQEQREKQEKNLIFLEKKEKNLKRKTQEQPNSPQKTDDSTERELKKWEKEYQLEQDILNELEIPDAESFEGDTEAPEADESPIELTQHKLPQPNPEFSHKAATRPTKEPDKQGSKLRNTLSQLHAESLAA